MALTFPNGLTIGDEQIALLRMEMSAMFTKKFQMNPLFAQAMDIYSVSGMFDVFSCLGAAPFSNGALHTGDSVTTSDASLFQLPVQLTEFADGVDIFRRQLRSLRTVDDIVAQIPAILVETFFNRLDAGLAEFVSNNIGTLGALDAVETVNRTWDNLTLINNTPGHLGGALDNQLTGSGTTQADIQTDVFTAITTLLSGQSYGTQNRYWGSQNILDTQPVIYYPISMAEDMVKAITAELHPAFINTATSNAGVTNVIAKMGIQLVASSWLDTIDVDDYYVFLTTKNHPSPQALSLAINTKTEFETMNIHQPQIPVGLEGAESVVTNMLRIEFPDPNGSDRYRIDRVWTPVISYDMTPVASNPYRIAKIVN